MSGVRQVVVVLGDQLDAGSSAFDGFDPGSDRVFMAEVSAEGEHVWSHKARIALFLAAMRHFRDELRARGVHVEYVELCDSTLGAELAKAVGALRPERVVVVEPGELRVREELLRAVPSLEVRPDRHFFCSTAGFQAWAKGRRQLRMELFYREMRRRTGLLMEGGLPAGGAFNFDASNRASFGARGPGPVRPPIAFPPDATTREVLDLVARRFASHPGGLDRFDWPVTRSEALRALDDFLAHRLPSFGRYEDAMWAGEPVLFHSRLSAAMNLKLLDPREVLRGAEAAWRAGEAPIESVEGFVRQVLGWREYVRGVYWLRMPEYLSENALGADRPLPPFYWTGETEMACLADVLGQTLSRGYAHHIQRLMVTGLYALLLGVRPVEVHRWYLAVYVDAVEWVELPNVIGMSQHADGGFMASKPYVATGKYLQRMGNHCRSCRFDPAMATGEKACPFTTLYWDFLARHRAFLAKNVRMLLQLKNLDRLPGETLREIRQRAASLRGASG
jgi:deoxyribodipyrimidine photolyase-related protein